MKDPYALNVFGVLVVLAVISSGIWYRILGYYFEKRTKDRVLGPGNHVTINFATFLVRALFFSCVLYYQINQIILLWFANTNDAICQVTLIGSSFMYGITKYWLYMFLFFKQAAVQGAGFGDPLQKSFKEYSRLEQALIILTQVYLLALIVFLIFARATIIGGLCTANYISGTDPVLKITSPVVAVFEVVLSISYLHLFMVPLRAHAKRMKEQIVSTSSGLLNSDNSKVARIEGLLVKNMVSCAVAMTCTLTNIVLSIVLTMNPPVIQDTFLNNDVLVLSAALDVFLNSLALLFCVSRDMWTDWYLYKALKTCCACIRSSAKQTLAQKQNVTPPTLGHQEETMSESGQGNSVPLSNEVTSMSNIVLINS
eukprot:TRINITY_DN11044_c0_g1_i1.p1 TRINITY_DN11044_c0_g1~~TRINITY_DN11044_c0_g1_i1.p1  ORF type:complete len:369 (+),score=79.73 TRINITY_DN11044_c0_g1_i1:31-1137(+)